MIDVDALAGAVASAGIPVTELRPAGAGECCRAWWVGEEHIVRVALDPCVDSALETEAEVLPLVSRAVDTAIPEPVHLGHDPSTGRRFLVHRAVIGASLEDTWPQLEAAARERIACALGRFLEQMQGVPLASLSVELPKARTPLDLRAELIDELVFPGMSAREVSACRALRNAFEPCPREAWTLVHADLYNHHVRVRDQALAGVIDFGDLCAGDPDCDLGSLMDDFGVEFVADLLVGSSDGDASRRLERGRCFCVWEALDWAAGELQAGRTAEVAENLQRVGRLAIDGAARL
ncbi:MAG: phosphotransferase [Myxococcota bacterium]